MNDNDVIKALELCLSNDWNKTKCRECSFYTGCLGCVEELKSAALDLINRQKEEINRLQKESDDKERAYTEEYILRKEMKEDINRLTVELQAMRGSANSYKMHYEDAQAEIESLKEENIILSQKRANIFEIISAYDRGRTGAIKEFAERLKLRFSGTLYCNGGTVVRAVDKIIKK